MNYIEKVRMLLLEQLEMILVYWNMEDLEPYFMDVVGVVQKGLQDPSQSVRKNCRGTFCMVSSKWYEALVMGKKECDMYSSSCAGFRTGLPEQKSSSSSRHRRHVIFLSKRNQLLRL